MPVKDSLGSGWQSWISEVLKVHGVSTVLLAVIVYGGWRTVEWSAVYVVEPLVTRQIQLMHAIEHSVESQQDVLEVLESSTRELHKSSTNTEKLVLENQEIMRKTLVVLEQHFND